MMEQIDILGLYTVLIRSISSSSCGWSLTANITKHGDVIDAFISGSY